jgi:formyl-CoA transferase
MNVDQLMKDPHVKGRKVIVEVPDTQFGSIMMHNVFPRLSRTPGRIRTVAPEIGQDQNLLDQSDTAT